VRRGCRPCMMLGVAVASSSVLLSAQTSATARPDFSGYWELRLDSFNVPSASLTTQAISRLAEQAKKDADALAQCVQIGMPMVMDDRATLDIRHAPTVIGVVAKSPSSTRHIYTDGRPHPEEDEIEGTTNGHSIGRWEGDVLVVDTIGFSERGVTRIPGGGYRTPRSHLVERYRLLENGQRLSVVFTWEGPEVFESPHTYEYRYYKVSTISEPRTFNCFADPERTRFLSSPPQAR